MNNKKAKKIRKLLEKAYGDKYPKEFLDYVNKRVKKNYSKLSDKEKQAILSDSEFLLTIKDQGV